MRLLMDEQMRMMCCLSSFAALQAGTQVSPNTIVSSVQMLALSLHFGIRNEVKMLPSFLRCFPNAEALCIEVKLTFSCMFLTGEHHIAPVLSAIAYS
jgi:hypothetical protein